VATWVLDKRKSELLGFLTFSDIFDIDAPFFAKNVLKYSTF